MTSNIQPKKDSVNWMRFGIKGNESIPTKGRSRELGLTEVLELLALHLTEEEGS